MLEFLSGIFMEIIFEGIILRFFKLFSNTYDKLVRILFGRKKELPQFKK